MKEKSIKRNYVYNVVYQVLAIIVPIITMPYVSRVLNAEGIGLYSYGSSIASYFVLAATLGTTVFGQRAISYVQGDIEARSRAFWELFIFRLISTAIALAAYAAVFFAFLKDNGTMYLILALNVVNVATDISWFFQGIEEFGKIVIRNVVFRILNLAAIFIFIKTASDLYKYVLIVVGFTTASNLSLWFMMKGNVCRVKGIKPFRDVKEILQFFIPTVATQIYTVLDKSMIGWFTGSDAENGYYEQAERIVKTTLTVVTALGTVMIPRVSKYFKEGKTDLMREYLYKSYRFTFLLAVPIAFGLLSTASTLVPVFLGDGYEPCVLLIQVFSALVILIGLSNANNLQLFVPTGRQNLLTVTVTVGAVVNAVLNVILIPRLAATGACVASVIAEGVVTLLGFVFIIKAKDLAVGKIFLSSWKYWVAGAAMCAAVYAVKSVMPIAVWALAALIVFGAVAYFLILLILRDELLIGSIKAVLFRLKKKPAEVPADENADNN